VDKTNKNWVPWQRPLQDQKTNFTHLQPCCLQCFDTVGWQEWHPACKKLEWWGAGMVICLERGADLYMAQLMPLPLTVSCFSKIVKSRLILPFWYPLTWVVPEKGPLNGCVYSHAFTNPANLAKIGMADFENW